MAKIYTSYFAKVKQLEEAGIVPVAISRYPPRWFDGNRMQELAPTGAMLKMTQEQYDIEFAKILGNLSKEEILGKIEVISMENGGKPVALLCFEKPSDYCHRHDVGRWLNEERDPEERIHEWGFTPRNTVDKYAHLVDS